MRLALVPPFAREMGNVGNWDVVASVPLVGKVTEVFPVVQLKWLVAAALVQL